MSAEFDVPFQITHRLATDAEKSKARHQEHLESPPTPTGVLLTYGVLWVLLGIGVLYLLITMDDERVAYLSSLLVLQYGAWAIGGCFILLGGYRLLRNHSRRPRAREG